MIGSLIVSSVGIWDVMDNEEAAHVVIARSCVMEDRKLQIDPSRGICEHAKFTGQFSVVVVDLKSCGNPQSQRGRY
jgi:hypothetical protein